MSNTWFIMRITFKEGIRSRILLGIGIFALCIFLANIAIIDLFAFELGKVMVDVGLAAISLSGLSIIFFLAINLISRDIHDKTIYMVLSKPVTRSQYIWGKFGGLTLLLFTAFIILGSLAVISFYTCCSLVPGAHLPRNFSWFNAVTTISFSFLAQLLLMSAAFFFTIRCSSMYLAMLLTFCIYLLGNSLETIVKIVEQGEFVETSPLSAEALKVVSWIIPNLAAFDLKANLAYGLPTDASYLLWTGLYGLTYTSLVIILTSEVFRRMDIC
jgi:ABC-type transport system involved in multi-copper enzyme maturation permease subunit